MNKKILLPFAIVLFAFSISFGQNLQVETILDLDASGGVTFGPDGNIYVSDFGPWLNQASSNTNVYKIEYGTWEVSTFASGFLGASGSRFDSQGNFYQSNPSGARVSKRSPDGTVDYNWSNTGMATPIGITNDSEENLYVCQCGNNTIRKITPDGTSTLFASSALFNCPNGITADPEDNLYACNFSDGKILKITPAGEVSTLVTLPVFGGVGNGHLTYKNGFLFVATIGTGQIYKLTLDGEEELIAGVAEGFSNTDGPAMQATFSKPNGIAASITGDTMWVNCSVPTWPTNSPGLHPGKVRMITGVCSLADVECPLLTDIKEVINSAENQYAKLFPPTPNPADTEMEVAFQIHNNSQQVKLKIVDNFQRVIKTLVEDKKAKGSYTFKINSYDWMPGTYFAVLESEKYVLTQKILVVK